MKLSVISLVFGVLLAGAAMVQVACGPVGLGPIPLYPDPTTGDLCPASGCYDFRPPTIPGDPIDPVTGEPGGLGLAPNDIQAQSADMAPSQAAMCDVLRVAIRQQTQKGESYHALRTVYMERCVK